ncbi:MAG: hypothetical protein IK152_09065 [Lachnospiraceae bacterium]|nr:hypothetical protein [Lachnospiraceae bacterium]
MKLKKANALLAILTMATLVIHAGYQSIAYILFFHDTMISFILGKVITVSVLCHIILSVIIVLVLHDSKTISYPGQNIKIILQRISAVGIGAHLLAHTHSFEKLLASFGTHVYILTEIMQIIYFAFLFIHIGTSLTNAFITLGCLDDIDKKKKIDHVIWVVCGIFFVGISILIPTVRLKLFSMM